VLVAIDERRRLGERENLLVSLHGPEDTETRRGGPDAPRTAPPRAGRVLAGSERGAPGPARPAYTPCMSAWPRISSATAIVLTQSLKGDEVISLPALSESMNSRFLAAKPP
jgi:hypothetical protein